MTIPTLFDPKSNHRLVHYFADRPSRDFDRLEDLLADAVAAARDGLKALDSLHQDHAMPIDCARSTLRDAIASQDLLGGAFLWAAKALIDAASELAICEHDAPILARGLQNLEAAARSVQRVEDLIASEREIARARDRHGGL